MKKIFVLIALSVLSAQGLRAQNVNSDTLVYKYHEVVISASRMSVPLKAIPFSTSLVGSQILNTLPRAIAMDEPLKLVPGVKVDNQANGSRVHLSIRGQGILTERGIRGIKTLLDGLSLNDPAGFAPDFYDIDFSTVDHIEVLRGPAAAIYGGGAAGGVINIETQNAPNTPLFGEASTTAGSNNFWKGSGAFGGNVGDVNYRVSFSRMIGDGYRQHTHFNGNNIYGKATYTPTDYIEITPIFCWADIYHENPEGLSLSQFNQDPLQPNGDAPLFNENLATSRATNGLTGVIRIHDNQELRFNGYVRRTIFTEANNHVFDHQTLTTPGTSLQYTLKSGSSEDFIKNKISLGTDLQWQTIDERQNPNDTTLELDTVLALQRIRQQGAGIFLMDVVELGKDWDIMASLRYDNIHNELEDLLPPADYSGSADFSHTTATLGVTFSPNQDMTLYGSWGQGFMPPSTNELDNNPVAYGGFNAQLVSATSNSFEVGARGTFNHSLDYEITGFYTTTDNDFDRFRIANRGHGTEGTFYRNAGRTKRLGAELYADYNPVKPVTIQLAYTYSQFKYDIASPDSIMMDDPTIHKFIVNGSWLPNSPWHQLMADVRYDVGPGVSVGLSGEVVSKVFIDGANYQDEAAPGYGLLNGRIVYHWHSEGYFGDLSIQARNIFDKTYVAFTEPDPGTNSYQPGAGREVFVGLKVGFNGK